MDGGESWHARLRQAFGASAPNYYDLLFTRLVVSASEEDWSSSFLGWKVSLKKKSHQKKVSPALKAQEAEPGLATGSNPDGQVQGRGRALSAGRAQDRAVILGFRPADARAPGRGRVREVSSSQLGARRQGR